MNRDDFVSQQIETGGLAGLLTTLYSFEHRLRPEFFWDSPEMPRPIITLEEEPAKRKGSYRPVNTAGLHHVINLNPFQHNTGIDLVETLAHEMVHLWEVHTGQPTIDNVHAQAFHDRMWSMYGIRTEGDDGRHTNVDERWTAWLEESCSDLELGKFRLPGLNRKPPRKMFKHTCPKCGATFHARTKMNVVCNEESCITWSGDKPNQFLVTS